MVVDDARRAPASAAKVEQVRLVEVEAPVGAAQHDGCAGVRKGDLVAVLPHDRPAQEEVALQAVGGTPVVAEDVGALTDALEVPAAHEAVERHVVDSCRHRLATQEHARLVCQGTEELGVHVRRASWIGNRRRRGESRACG